MPKGRDDADMSERQGIPENAIVLTGRAWVRPEDLVITFSRASGPGGQHVNKVSTRATLRIAVDAVEGLSTHARDRLRDLAGGRLNQDDTIMLHADSSRSQRRNREEVLERLRDLVRKAAIRPKVRRTRKPSRAMIERRLNQKKQRADRKRDRKRPDW